MRSRSSRLFIVLLHLVGVQTNIPLNDSIWKTGIVGVNPATIVLENLILDPTAGLDGLVKRMPQEVSEGILSDPYWLQDDFDGKCLGPTGFSQCGDSTLWTFRRQNDLPKPEKEKWNKFSIWPNFHTSQSSSDDMSSKYYIEYDDQIQLLRDPNKCVTMSKNCTNKSSPTRERKKTFKPECLNARVHENSLQLGSCTRHKSQGWDIDGNGIFRIDTSVRLGKLESIKKLLHGATHDALTTQTNIGLTKNDKIGITLCISRTGDKAASVTPCDMGSSPTSIGHRVVKFSLVRYKVNPNLGENDIASNFKIDATPVDSESKMLQQRTIDNEDHPTHHEEKLYLSTNDNESNLPHVMTSSESHSRKLPIHPNVRSTSLLLSTSLSSDETLSILDSKTKALRIFNISRMPQSDLQLGHNTSLSSLSKKDNSEKRIGTFRKIPVHPYIQSSQNGIWNDPQTDLNYHTDLCEYLGDKRKEKGRHTLMGVGQYLKTVFNIKVYGIAFYVSKWDVLADPNFEQFASLDVGDLRSSENFYEYLRSDIKVDRSIFLKLNMQLGVDTMRSSLEADWKMLTSEHKKMLLDSSMKPRLANERMFEKVNSAENPSKCSCTQILPAEMNADSSCCARGTELVFTWRNNGNFEIRMDGRLLDTFQDNALGKAIFYEYLRTDDPISADALFKFVEGFPFVLAPLAQVKGVNLPHNKVHESSSGKNHHRDGGFQPRQVLSWASDRLRESGSWFQARLNRMSLITEGPKIFASETLESLGNDLNNKRDETLHHIDVISTRAFIFMLNRIPLVPNNQKEKIIANIILSKGDNSLAMVLKRDWETSGVKGSTAVPERWCHRNLLDGYYSCDSTKAGSTTYEQPCGSSCGSVSDVSYDFTDTIFLYSVHFYLLLLLIVSLPENTTTKIRLGVRR